MSIVLGGTLASGAAGIQNILFQGQDCTQVTLAGGDRLVVALQGAQVLSWCGADGQERLYLSPLALTDGASPIRGGVPLCFPQFNTRMLGSQALPKHGFVRNLRWAMHGVQLGSSGAELSFGLSSNEATRALWPHEFAATLGVRLEPQRLRISFSVSNTGAGSWPFAAALHTYLRVPHVSQVALHGLQGHTYWDAVQHLHQPAQRLQETSAALRFDGETDRVYEAVQTALTLAGPSGQLSIAQSPSMSEVVVWNPAAERCASLGDMPADGWAQMLCVEAACINTPVVLAPGQAWSGWQELAVRGA